MDITSLTHVQYYGIAFFLLGCLFILYVYYKRFNRRGVAGLQHFPNFFLSLIIRFFEGLILLVGILATLTGAFFLLLEWYNKS
ncbi:hypothetical protein [Olivibacter domesticus]|uniref:hypothetical protein n=1 Tax=Olivibacter domesticus TaxID=407022 RepID=UPI001113949D|nr:hypothetical protein [Olivibacter domesticus]